VLSLPGSLLEQGSPRLLQVNHAHLAAVSQELIFFYC